MTQTQIKITLLTASQGHTLTNGQVYGKEVYLGKHDKAENWHEISDGEYADIVAQMEAATQEGMYKGASNDV